MRIAVRLRSGLWKNLAAAAAEAAAATSAAYAKREIKQKNALCTCPPPSGLAPSSPFLRPALLRRFRRAQTSTLSTLNPLGALITHQTTWRDLEHLRRALERSVNVGAQRNNLANPFPRKPKRLPPHPHEWKQNTKLLSYPSLTMV